MGGIRGEGGEGGEMGGAGGEGGGTGGGGAFGLAGLQTHWYIVEQCNEFFLLLNLIMLAYGMPECPSTRVLNEPEQ